MENQSAPKTTVKPLVPHPSPITSETALDAGSPAYGEQSLTPELVVGLQRVVGNRQVQRLVNVRQRASANTISRHPDDALSAAVETEKLKVVEARSRAEARGATPETLAECLRIVNKCIENMTRDCGKIERDGWKRPAVLKLDNAKLAKTKIEELIETARVNDTKFEEVQKLKVALVKKYGKAASSTGSSFNTLAVETRTALSEIVGATTETAINLHLGKTNTAKGKATTFLSKFAGFVLEAEGEISKAGVFYDTIANGTLARTNAMNALDDMRGVVAGINEAETLAKALDTYVKRGAEHAQTLATAKLLVITKAAEAKKARETAAELQKVVDDAKIAAENFQKALELVKSQTAELANLKSAAEKNLLKAQETLAKELLAKTTLEQTLGEGQAEDYMAEGYLEAADEAIEAAISTVALAETALREATSEHDKGVIALGTAQNDFDVANSKATDPEAIQAAKLAGTTATQAEESSRIAGETAGQTSVNTQAESLKDEQDQALTRDLRTLVGTQTELNKLLVLMPNKAELKKLIVGFNVKFVTECLNAPAIGAAKLQPFFVAFKDTYVKDITDENQIKGIIRDLPVATINEVETEITYDKLKEWLKTVDSATFKSYLTALTNAKFCEWQKQYTVAEIKDLITKITIGKFKDLVTEFTVTDFKNNYVADFTLKGVMDFYSEFTIAEFKLYVVTMTYDILKDRVNVKKLKANALKKYGALWLKNFVGAGQDSKDHLLEIKINGSNVISGGHDKATFEAFLNDEIDEDTHQKQGSWVVTGTRGTISDVTYTLYWDDGSFRGSGLKTLINGLTGSIDTWAGRATNALWKAIKNCTFDKTVAPFTVSDGTYTFSGFYNNPKSGVDTFYPV